MNDNVMMTNAVVCLSDRKRAREIAMSAGRGYLNTMVNMYHDTMPPQQGAVKWPDTPLRHPRRGDPRLPDRGRLPAVRHARRRARADRQVPGGRLRPARLRHPERGLRARGGARDDRAVRHRRSSPSYDDEPGPPHHPHAGATAKRKYPDFAHPLPEGLDVSVIPTNALLPLGS